MEKTLKRLLTGFAIATILTAFAVYAQTPSWVESVGESRGLKLAELGLMRFEAGGTAQLKDLSDTTLILQVAKITALILALDKAVAYVHGVKVSDEVTGETTILRTSVGSDSEWFHLSEAIAFRSKTEIENGQVKLDLVEVRLLPSDIHILLIKSILIPTFTSSPMLVYAELLDCLFRSNLSAKVVASYREGQTERYPWAEATIWLDEGGEKSNKNPANNAKTKEKK